MPGFDVNDFGDQADLVGMVQRNRLIQDQTAARAEREEQKSLPQCPFCGGRLRGQFEKCKHCGSTVAWVAGIPCKPGEEGDVRTQLAEAGRIEAQKRKEASRFRDELKKERWKHKWTDGMAAVLFVLLGGVVGWLFLVVLGSMLGGDAIDRVHEFLAPFGVIVSIVGFWNLAWQQSKDEIDIDKKLKTGIYLSWRNLLRRKDV